MTDGKEAIAETEVIVEVQNVVEIVVMVTVEVEVEKDQKGIVVIAEVGVGKEFEGVNIAVQKNADTAVTIAMIQGLQCQGLLKRRRNLTLILLKGK
jgi:adenylylsulfate kinase-like enzyme